MCVHWPVGKNVARGASTATLYGCPDDGPIDSASEDVLLSDVRYQPSELYPDVLHARPSSPDMPTCGWNQNDTVRLAGWRYAAVPSLSALEPLKLKACP